jgi:hypothetical protein
VSLFGARQAESHELQLFLDGPGSAGLPLHGEVDTAAPVTVALMRLERSPSGLFAFAVTTSRAEPSAGRARFELLPPEQLPPAAVGRRCEIDYAVRAVSDSPRRTRRKGVVPVALSAGAQVVHMRNDRFDRVIPSHTARHFHLELVEALLEGGGRISGRVHGDHQPVAGITVTARCEELWCTNFRFRPRRSPPLWRGQPLWEQTARVEAGPDRRWCPFRFELPDRLPPAVEGRAVAWRYTVEARRPARRGFAESAIVAPLRFEI